MCVCVRDGELIRVCVISVCVRGVSVLLVSLLLGRVDVCVNSLELLLTNCVCDLCL